MLEQLLHNIEPKIAAILAACLDDCELKPSDALPLFYVCGSELLALTLTADELRRRQAGDTVTYVVNRNINFTNVCVKSCKFCAFSRDLRSEQGYYLPVDEIVRRVRQAVDFGASEVCLQAGLAPSVDGRHYIELCQAIKTAVPQVHLHAFSPEEIKYGALRAKLSFRDYLQALKNAGLDSLPGTSAEILDDRLRKRISPGRISVEEWLSVIRTAHELGIPTTSTMMFGHVETFVDRICHLTLLRDLQKQTGGFTEFVPLSFVHAEAPLFVQQQVDGVAAGPTGTDIVRLYAIARLFLGPTFKNIQASWVKEGLRMAQWLLNCGVNDLGGTLMNESISTSAGAQHGQLMTPATLRQAIRDAGRTPAERTTTYGLRKVFARDYQAGEELNEPLSAVRDATAVFGSYNQLTRDARFHYDFDKHFEAERQATLAAN